MAEADPIEALRAGSACVHADISADKRVLFINAREDGFLAQLQADCQQYFRPFAAELEVRGRKVVPVLPDVAGAYDVVLMLGARQHEECLHAMAMGLRALKQGGHFIAAAANDAGGRRLADDLRAFGVGVVEDSKAKSRIVRAMRPDRIDEKFMADALAGGEVRQLPGMPYWSQPGVFSWDRIDAGSEMLARFLKQEKLAGRGGDFGCGYGYLSHEILARHESVAHITAIDADARSAECARRTLQPFADRFDVRWGDVEGGADMPDRLDFIVMNPPFHKGAKTIPEVGRAFVSRSARSLRTGGVLWMVANTHLPYEDVLKAEFSCVTKIAEENGYKTFKAGK